MCVPIACEIVCFDVSDAWRLERIPQSLVAQPPVQVYSTVYISLLNISPWCWCCVCLCVCVTQMGEGRGCVLCRNGLDKFGYRDVLLLRQFVTPAGLIIGRRQTGQCDIICCVE